MIRVNIPSVHLHGRNLSDLLSVLEAGWTAESDLMLDFSGCWFVNAEAAATLAAFALHRGESRTVADWPTIDGQIVRQLRRWRIARLLGGSSATWSETVVPLLAQTALDADSLMRFLNHYVLQGGMMPEMTPDLRYWTWTGVSEVVQNVFRHADSPIGAVILGQLYPRNGTFQLCIVDSGVGIVERVRSSGVRVPTGGEIAWALKEGTSTSPEDGPNGIGLHILRSFVDANSGSLRIYANDRCLRQEGGRVRTEPLSFPFPGTLFSLTLNVRDGVVYSL